MAAPHPSTNDKFLLFDDHYVSRKKGFVLRLGELCRDPDPVVVPDRPWEFGGIKGDSNCTVIDDGGRLHMWYAVIDPRPGRHTKMLEAGGAKLADLDEKTRRDFLDSNEAVLCHAVSRDGVQWEKPPADALEFNGTRQNNMVIRGRMGATVFLDPHDVAERRFKLIHGFGPALPHRASWHEIDRKIFHAVYGSWSADGLHWTTHPQPIMDWYTDTTNVAFFDERIGKYVAYVRFNQNMGFRNRGTYSIRQGAEHYRAIGRSESDDFFSFPPPVKIAQPTPRQRRPRATGMDYYNTAAMISPGTSDGYVMLSSNFYHEQDVLQVHLATSRDGIHFTRWPEPLLGPGPAGRFDCRSIYMATGAICRGSEMWLYYHGRDWKHGETPRKPRSGAIGRVRMRLDGFACQRARAGGGELLTVPVKSGECMSVNMNADGGGRLKVVVCDETGAPLPGYTESEADWLFYNDVNRIVTWNGDPRLPKPERKIRLRFLGTNVNLFAFQFHKMPNA